MGRGSLRSLDELEPAFQWLAAHRSVREVLVSGGDPLVAPERWLEALLVRLRGIAHLELLRIGTRVPVTLPMRVDRPLAELLRRFAPLYVATHFNHPREVTDEARVACATLVDRGVPLVNQAVLLRGVNDCARIQAELNRALLRARVRPYYLMQCDAVAGTAHLRASVGRGLAIMAALRGALTGLGLPSYVLDLPGGAGKVPLEPGYFIRREGRELVFRGPRGGIARYRDAEETSSGCESCWCPEQEAAPGAQICWRGEGRE